MNKQITKRGIVEKSTRGTLTCSYANFDTDVNLSIFKIFAINSEFLITYRYQTPGGAVLLQAPRAEPSEIQSEGSAGEEEDRAPEKRPLERAGGHEYLHSGEPESQGIDG